jgi:dGTP triphosphohydrolase
MVMGAPRWPLLALCLDAIQARYQHASETVLLNWRDLSRFSFADARQADLLVRRLRSELIFQLTSDVVLGSEPALAQWESTFLPSKSPTELDERVKAGHLDFTHLITFVTLAEPYQALKHNLQDLVVKSERVSRMDGKADYLLHRILKIYLAHPRQCHRTVLEYAHDSDPSIPRDVSHMSDADVPGLGKNEAFIRAAVDYVAGMTDRFALREYDQLYSAYPRAEL